MLKKGVGLLTAATKHMGIITLADQGFVSAANFLTGVIIGRICTREQFGLYILGFTIVSFLMDIQTSLISSPYTVYSPRLKNSGHAQYSGSTLIHQLSLSVLAMVGLVAGGLALCIGIGPQDLLPVVWALVVVITFILLREYARRICFAGLRMKTALVLDFSVALGQISGVGLVAYLGFLSASSAYWVIGIACGIAALGWLMVYRKAFSFNFNQIISDLRHNWLFGKWVFAGNMLSLISSQYLSPWLVTGFVGAGATGVFGACWWVVALVNPFLIGLGNFLGPRLAHANTQGILELKKVILKATFFIIGITGLFCFVLILWGGSLVVLVYGSKYAGNNAVVSVLALSVVASAVSLAVGYGLWALERPQVNFKVSIIQLGVTLTIGLMFVKPFGLLGIACGLLAGNAAASIVRCIVFNRLVRSMGTMENTQ
jgi:O-antigen/teichoic acid export membrane protein